MRHLALRICFIIILWAILFPSITFAAVVQLPQTGQSVCYNAQGTVISCTDTGQDGDLKTGSLWSDHRFTVNTDDTVTDNVTGLVWAKDATTPKYSTCTGDAMTWQQSLDYVKCLNTNFYLGYNDWRLPNVLELESLVHAQKSSTSSWLNSRGFSGVEADFYWSSTSLSSNKALAQSVYMGDGTLYAFSGHKTMWLHLAWPVRSGESELSDNQALWKTGQTGCYDGDGEEVPCTGTGQDGELLKGAAWPSTRFSDNNNETITDNLTGLIWTKDANTPGPSACGAAADKTWQQALDHIACINTANYLGFNDWRLPNRKELLSLVDFSRFNPSIPAGSPFANVKSGGYWSSSSLTFNDNTHFAFFVEMANGYVDSDDKSLYPYAVWPVRAGEYIAAAISVSPDSLDFGNITVGKTSSGKIVTISNSGNADLRISSIAFTGDDSEMFALETDTCSSLAPTISAGSSCTITAVFSPSSIGNKNTTLRISSDDPVTADLDMSVSGTGIQKACNFSLSPKNKTAGASGGTGSINVKSLCDWTSSSDSEWLAITSGSSGAKSGKITYSVSANAETSSRTGTITVEGKTFTVVQQGLADLAATVSGITSSPAGKSYRLFGNITAYNTSDIKAAGIIVKVYLSNDAVYDIDDKLLKSIAVGTLNGSSQRTKSLNTIKMKDNPSGKYIIILIDPSDKIREADETNNTTASEVIP